MFSDVSMLRKLEKERIALESSRREEAETARQLQEEFIDGEREFGSSMFIVLN